MTSPHTVLVTLFCQDRPGLVAAVAGTLFDLGANMGDTSFAVLGEAAELSALCELPGDVRIEEVQRDLAALPETAGGTLKVEPFSMQPTHGPSARITHRILLSGGDRPGLVARLAEVFVQYRANIVRLNSERSPGETIQDSGTMRYVLRLAVNIPAEVADSCLATVVNTAGELGLACAWERA